MKVQYIDGKAYELCESIAEALEILDGTLPVWVSSVLGGLSFECDEFALKGVRAALVGEATNRWHYSPEHRDRAELWPKVFRVSSGNVHVTMSPYSENSILHDPRQGGEE